MENDNKQNDLYNKIITRCNYNESYFNNLRSFLRLYDNEILNANISYQDILNKLFSISILQDQIIKIKSNIEFIEV